MPRTKREVPWLDWRNGVAYAKWYDAAANQTKRLSLHTSDPGEAARRFGAFLLEGQDIRDPARVDGLTSSHALDDYWREHVQVKVIDKKRQEDAISHLKAWFKNTPLHEIDIPASRAYAAARRSGQIGGGRRRGDGQKVLPDGTVQIIDRSHLRRGSDATIRRELVTLQAAANHALKWKRVKADGMPSIELPAETGREAISDDEWLTREELALAIEKATGHLRDFIVITYDTASRRGAVENLTKFQVDLRAGRVNLRGPHETDLQRRSKKRRPVVPIGAAARPVYERLVKDSETEFLFGTPSEMYRPFRAHMESLGLGHKSHPHILRHTRASHLLQEGVDIWAVAKLLGDTVATVERVYGHQCPEYLAETMAPKRGA